MPRANFPPNKTKLTLSSKPTLQSYLVKLLLYSFMQRPALRASYPLRWVGIIAKNKVTKISNQIPTYLNTPFAFCTRIWTKIGRFTPKWQKLAAREQKTPQKWQKPTAKGPVRRGKGRNQPRTGRHTYTRGCPFIYVVGCIGWNGRTDQAQGWGGGVLLGKQSPHSPEPQNPRWYSHCCLPGTVGRPLYYRECATLLFLPTLAISA